MTGGPWEKQSQLPLQWVRPHQPHSRAAPWLQVARTKYRWAQPPTLRAAARAREDAREVHVFWGPPSNPPPSPKPNSFRVAELPEGSEL